MYLCSYLYNSWDRIQKLRQRHIQPIFSRTFNLRQNSSGAVAVEAAIVVPILVILTLALLEYGYVFFANQRLSYAASAGVERASFLEELEIPGEDGTQNDDAEAEVIEYVMEKASLQFSNSTGQDIGNFSHTETDGSRITSISLDIGDPQDGSITDLRPYLKQNPIIISVEADIPSFFGFFKQKLTARIAGAAEPRYNSNITKVFGCDGVELTAEQVLNGNIPQGEQCPCVLSPNDPRMVTVAGNCACATSPYTYFHDDTSIDPGGTSNGVGNDNGIIDPGECICDPNSFVDDPLAVDCECITCNASDCNLPNPPASCPDNQGFINATLFPDEDCACRCLPPYEGPNDDGECVCNDTACGGCDPALFGPAVCKPEQDVFVVDGVCECRDRCAGNLAQCVTPDPNDPYSCICDSACVSNQCAQLNSSTNYDGTFIPDPNGSPGSPGCGCICDPNNIPTCPNGEVFNIDTCQCELCENGQQVISPTECACVPPPNCSGDEIEVNCGCQACPDPLSPNNAGTECVCDITELSQLTGAGQECEGLGTDPAVYTYTAGGACECRECQPPLIRIGNACKCPTNLSCNHGYTLNNTTCNCECLPPATEVPGFLCGNPGGSCCLPPHCNQGNCTWDGSGWVSDEG